MAEQDNTFLPWLLLGAGVGVIALSTKTGREILSPGPGYMNPTDFVTAYFKYAKATEKSYKVPLQVTLAQAAVESFYGKSAPGFNFFGIKAGKSWTGETQKLKTWECGKTGDKAKDGIKDEIIAIYPPGDPKGICTGMYSYRVYGTFRKYKSALDSFIDHAKFFLENKRYAPAFNYNDPKQFATAIAQAGYATAPNYAAELHKLIDTINSIIIKNKLT